MTIKDLLPVRSRIGCARGAGYAPALNVAWSTISPLSGVLPRLEMSMLRPICSMGRQVLPSEGEELWRACARGPDEERLRPAHRACLLVQVTLAAISVERGEQESQVKAEDDFTARYPSEPRLTNELISRELMPAALCHILLNELGHPRVLADSPCFRQPLSTARPVVIGASQRARQTQCFTTSAMLGRGEADSVRHRAAKRPQFGRPRG